MLTLGILLAMPAALLAQPTSTPKIDQPYVLTLPGSVVKIKFIPVAGGTIKIGDKEVKVAPYYLAETETPWEAYDVFTASGPSSKPYDQTVFPVDAVARPSKSYILPDLGWGHHGYPAINLSIDSATMFCRWLAQATKMKFRLPTEAEWEFACREGQGDAYKLETGQIDKREWTSENSDGTTHPIGKKAPNKLGFYDMLGNTGEWATDLSGKSVICGGSFRDDANPLNPTLRKSFEPTWQATDPQIPKSRWWLSDAPFCGFRILLESTDVTSK